MHAVDLGSQVLFTSLTEAEWDLLEDIEAICSPLAMEIQSERVTSSYFLLWRQRFHKHVQKESYERLDRNKHRSLGQTYKTQDREETSRSNFSSDSSLCISRLTAQLELRFSQKQRNPNNVVRDDIDLYIAMCCDPRVKGYGKYPKLFNLSEDECSIDAFKTLHRKYFVEMPKVSNASMLQSSSLKSNNISSNTSEERSSDAFDEMDLAMVQPRPGISTTHSSADAIVNRWFEHEVDFSTLATENVTKT